MKIEILSPCIGTNELRHLEEGELLEVTPDEAHPLLLAGKARLVRPQDKAEAVAHAQTVNARALRMANGGLR